MELTTLSKILNTEFSPPFLKEGEVRATIQEDGTLKIYIGPRDIHISAEGEVLGAGTCAVGKAVAPPALPGSD